MLKILIAPDSFKGSVSATQVSQLIKNSIENSQLKVNVEQVSLADGGEGSLEAIKQSRNFQTRKLDVYNPLFKGVTAEYLFDEQKNTAYIELAQASGYHLVNNAPDIMNSSTFGTGQLIAHAVLSGAKKIILFIGGSATNDAGLGILEALGYQFFNSEGEKIKPSPVNFLKISKIDESTSILKKQNVEIIIAADVINPFYGPNGAAYVYAKQKGANPKQIKQLNEGLRHISELISQYYQIDIQNINGAGAAGGTGGGLYAMVGAKVVSGSDFIFKLLKIEEKIKQADIIISGEGKIDQQSLNSKLFYNISKLVCKYNKKLWAVCGFFEGEEKIIHELNIEKLFCLAQNKDEIPDAILEARLRIEKACNQMIEELQNSSNTK